MTNEAELSELRSRVAYLEGYIKGLRKSLNTSDVDKPLTLSDFEHTEESLQHLFEESKGNDKCISVQIFSNNSDKVGLFIIEYGDKFSVNAVNKGSIIKVKVSGCSAEIIDLEE